MTRRSMLRRERRFLCVAAAGGLAALLAWPQLAQAQFQKTPWPPAQPTPALELTDLQGQRWTNASLKGRAVVLNFWATWCPPCKEELPSLQTLHEIVAGSPW